MVWWWIIRSQSVVPKNWVAIVKSQKRAHIIEAWLDIYNLFWNTDTFSTKLSLMVVGTSSWARMCRENIAFLWLRSTVHVCLNDVFWTFDLIRWYNVMSWSILQWHFIWSDLTSFYCVICNADPFATTFWWYIVISQNVQWKGLDIDGCVQSDGDSKDLRCWHQRFKTTLNDCQFAWTHTHMHVHTYTHVRTRTHAHTHTHRQSLFLSVKFDKFPSLFD